MRFRSVALMAAVAGMVGLLTVPALAVEDQPGPGLAIFEGEILDLSEGWGDAQACVVWDNDHGVECFRSEAELVARIAVRESSQTMTSGDVTVASSCSSSLRLYDGTSFTGQVLYLYQRSTWINLSNYGFSNRTSSFIVGACSTYLADYSNGGGSWYPTSLTTAGSSATYMTSGWNNRVSSVYIR